jgi:hypothetical protein
MRPTAGKHYAQKVNGVLYPIGKATRVNEMTARFRPKTFRGRPNATHVVSLNIMFWNTLVEVPE